MTSALTILLALLALEVQDTARVAATLRPDWRVISFPDGSELRYLPPQVTAADYPSGALRADAQGRSVVRLEVDASGLITSCSTARSSGSPDLDAQACQLYRSRARFELRGKSGPIILPAPITWQLEDGPPPADEMPQDGK